MEVFAKKFNVCQINTRISKATAAVVQHTNDLLFLVTQYIRVAFCIASEDELNVAILEVSFLLHIFNGTFNFLSYVKTNCQTADIAKFVKSVRQEIAQFFSSRQTSFFFKITMLVIQFKLCSRS